MGIVMGPDNVREETLRRMMTRYKNDLMRMCVAYLKDAALAEDAVQETFVKAYKALNEKQKILELWHGPTCAFKDMALSILPHLMTTAAKKHG